MKLTQDEHTVMLIAAGVSKETAAAQYIMLKEERRQFVSKLKFTLNNVPDKEMQISAAHTRTSLINLLEGMI